VSGYQPLEVERIAVPPHVVNLFPGDIGQVIDRFEVEDLYTPAKSWNDKQNNEYTGAADQ
jgi:hypothetical protein